MVHREMKILGLSSRNGPKMSQKAVQYVLVVLFKNDQTSAAHEPFKSSFTVPLTLSTSSLSLVTLQKWSRVQNNRFCLKLNSHLHYFVGKILNVT